MHKNVSFMYEPCNIILVYRHLVHYKMHQKTSLEKLTSEEMLPLKRAAASILFH